MRILLISFLCVLFVGCVPVARYKMDKENSFDLGMAYGLGLSLHVIEKQKNLDDASYFIQGFMDRLADKHVGIYGRKRD